MTASIPERGTVTAEVFNAEILPAGRPVVLRGQVADWPVVQAARQSREALLAYMRRFDKGARVGIVRGEPSIKGRLFYNEALTDFNFKRTQAEFGQVLYELDHQAKAAQPEAIAIQSAYVHDCIPGFQHENRLSLLPAVEPRIWFGNAVTVATHHDPSENIACVTAGKRRFTLFPPEQLANLYMGPFEKSPAGATISMVDLDNPDLTRYPKFAEALGAAMVGELEPGDALFIPYHWWHSVKSVEPVNMLINYWWTAPNPRPLPRDAFMLAMLSIKDQPPHIRECWRIMFEHYIFQQHGPPGEHLPQHAQGIAGKFDEDTAERLRNALARSLSGR